MTNTTAQSPAPQASVIALTSLVSGSQVGGAVTTAVLNAWSIRAQLVPTVVLGRHPGLGSPGGGAVSADLIAAALEGLAANERFHEADAVFTGYFQTAEQVRVAALAIRAARSRRPDLIVMVDPIIGDGPADGSDGRLYVSSQTAQAIRDELLPLATVITPNIFELSWLAGEPVHSQADVLRLARTLCPVTLVTSAPAAPDQVSVILATADDGLSFTAPRLSPAPNGTGDVFAASVLAEHLSGRDWASAAARAMARTSHILSATLQSDPRDLLLTQETLNAAITHPTPRRIGAQRPAWVMGLDGCKAGWAGVMVDLNGLKPPRHDLFTDFKSAFDWGAQVICVDIPIGFQTRFDTKAGRACEQAARAILGPRRSSIFSSPLRPALKADSYEAANILNRRAGGPGLSKQVYNLFPKIRDVDQIMTPDLSRSIVFETHPETVFAILSGAPAAHKKSTPQGRSERLALLRDQGLPHDLFEPHGYARKQCAPDDLIDAGLCALTAVRVAQAKAVTLPDDPPFDDRGLMMAIHA